MIYQRSVPTVRAFAKGMNDRYALSFLLLSDSSKTNLGHFPPSRRARTMGHSNETKYSGASVQKN
jgi:hypothetical protein